MPRTITVKGIGKVSAKPDLVVISVNLESKDMEYDKAMEQATVQLGQLREAVETIGFEKDALKTLNFNVRTEYDSVRDSYGNYQQKFNGYVVWHNLKLEFDFESKRLAQVLSAIAGCLSNPELNISFTVKDSDAVKEEMLRLAAKNAKGKAEILCTAAGVKLGKLLNIDYNWSEINMLSNTRYAVTEDCGMAPMMAKGMDIAPEDVKLSDTATFVWEMEE